MILSYFSWKWSVDASLIYVATAYSVVTVPVCLKWTVSDS